MDYGELLCFCPQRKDLLQLMIDASEDESKEGLKTGEIIADSVGFMLAGYETTSTTLAFATYLLATNPEVQERLANEIHEYFEENPVSDRHTSYWHIPSCLFPAMHSCPYMLRKQQYNYWTLICCIERTMCTKCVLSVHSQMVIGYHRYI